MSDKKLMLCDKLTIYHSKSLNLPIYMASEVDAAIAELKKKLMPCLNGDCILTCEVVEKYGKENAVLKQKLEDVQASHYAEMVDAGMRERRLRRALWLARAERASDKARIFYFAETCGVKLNIDGYSNKEKGHTRMCTAREWRITWLKVERKCREKAEEYKR